MIDSEGIKQLLPHRYPFLLIDRVLEYDTTRLRALKNVSVNEAFFQGHFPVRAVMPGVLIIEAMAQSAALLYRLTQTDKNQNDIQFYLTGVDKTRFRSSVLPGDQLLLEAHFLLQRSHLLRFECFANIAEKKVATATISASFH